MQALLIFALVVGATISTGPEQVPTSLCHDPLLGPSMIIYSDCGGVQEEPEKQKEERHESVERLAEQDAAPLADQLAEEWNEQPVEPSNEQPAKESPKQETGQAKEKPAGPADEQTDGALKEPVTDQKEGFRIEQPVEKTKENKQRCNKGSGNGGEGCDPGNHPEKGNDDENTDEPAQKGKKIKTERATEQETLEMQKCNKGSGNGAEGCDPGNHPEKGNNDEGGDRRPQNSKKEMKQK